LGGWRWVNVGGERERERRRWRGEERRWSGTKLRFKAAVSNNEVTIWKYRSCLNWLAAGGRPRVANVIEFCVLVVKSKVQAPSEHAPELFFCVPPMFQLLAGEALGEHSEQVPQLPDSVRRRQQRTTGENAECLIICPHTSITMHFERNGVVHPIGHTAHGVSFCLGVIHIMLVPK
jgi:hypothetical protein